MKFLRMIGLGVLFLTVLGMVLWGGLALYFQLSGLWQGVFVSAWIALGLVTLWRFFYRDKRWMALGKFAVVCVVFFGWWISLEPRLDRDWWPEVAQTVTGEFDGSQVTLHNVRNFDWRAPDDYTARWDSRDYDLDKLETVDMILSYWGNEAIAHTLVSFGFSDGQHVVFSVEIRKEIGEAYSTIGGFFKRYELAIIAADERDIVRVRTSVRDPLEDVYLYPLVTTKEHREALFRGYIEKANALAGEAAWYNTLTANCTTVIYALVKEFRTDEKIDKRLILSGYLPEYMAEREGINWSKPYGNLRERAAISQKALAIKDGEDFSEVIRRNGAGE